MANTKKISVNEFIYDCICKQYEITSTPKNFNSYDELLEYSKTHPEWFQECHYTSESQYDEMMDYFLEHFYDCKPKRYSKKIATNEFSWFMLQYGGVYDFLKHE